MKSRIITHQGNKVFEIDNKIFIPAAFRSFRPTPANVSLFYRNGVRLFQMQCSGLKNTWHLPYSNYGPIWVGDHQYSFWALDQQMEMFMKFAPEGYFMLMVQLDMPEWWRAENPCAPDSYYRLGEAALEEKWIRDACDYLQAFIEYAEKHYGDRIFAYSFSAGSCTEWFDAANGEISQRKADDYRAKTGNPTAIIPSLEQIRSIDLPSLRGDDSPVYQYQKYCSDLIPDLILRFAQTAQSVLHHQKILGLFFGYTTLPVGWQNQCGTNGYEKVWASRDIDMLFSPAAYECRMPGDAASYQYTVDSIALHHKLYLHEIDHHTYLSKYPTEIFMMMSCDYEDEFQTIAVLRRELCAAVVKGSSLWWFDMQGGWYASPGLEAEIHHEMNILEELYEKTHQSVSEIAVFADPMSFLRMPDANRMPLDLVQRNRDSLHHCGAPYDYFNLKDIGKTDLSRYKLCIFLNAVEMSAEIKQVIAQKLQHTVKVWLYAPNWATGGISEVCPIKLAETNNCEGKVQYQTEIFGFTDPVSPLYGIDDPEAEIIAYYTDGVPACARKGKDIFIPVGNVPFSLWRDIAKSAGVHLYSDTPGALYVDSRFVAKQNIREREHTIHMLFDCIVEELFDGGIYMTKDRELKYIAEKGEMKLFVIRERLDER